jgi:hypothetical protein
MIERSRRRSAIFRLFGYGEDTHDRIANLLRGLPRGLPITAGCEEGFRTAETLTCCRGRGSKLLVVPVFETTILFVSIFETIISVAVTL